MTRNLNIAIAGGGVAGLASAAYLARAGHRVVVFDKAPAPRPVGSGLMLQPVGQAVLEELGLLDAALASGRRIDAMLGRLAPAGRTVLDVSYDPRPIAEDERRFGLAIHRASLYDALRSAADAAGAVLEMGRDVVSAAESGRGRRLRFRGGASDGPFELVVDALGQRSALIEDVAKPLPFGALWATLDWPADPAAAGFHEGLLEQRYVAARKMTGVMPTGTLPGEAAEKATYFWSMDTEGFAAWPERHLDEWRDEARALWPETAIFLDQIADKAQLIPARYRHRTLKRPAEPGLIHIGDAWHATSPQLGQGANMALLDARALAGAIAAHDDLNDAFADFLRRRSRHIAIYQAISLFFTPFYQSNDRIRPVIRDWITAPLIRLPFLRGTFAKLACGDLATPDRGMW